MLNNTEITSRRKLNVEVESLVNGASASGKLGEVKALTDRTGAPIMSKYGKTLETFDLIQPTGEVRTFWVNGGIKGAFYMAKVQPGMNIEIVHTGKKTLEDWDNEIDTYDIYAV